MSSNLPESGRNTPPPASVAKSALAKSSPVSKIPPYFIQHKRDQVHAFDHSILQLVPLPSQEFLKCLDFNDALLPSMIPPSLCGFLSIDGFLSLANGIAEFIRAEHFTNDDLLVFRRMGNNTPYGHVTGTKCRPDITAAFEKDWIKDENGQLHLDWALMRLAGEKASGRKSFDTQKKNAATYLHYLLLARPDFLVAQGLLTISDGVVFLVGIGGVGIQQLKVKWEDENLYRFLYAFIYRLYNPSHFVDPSYTRTEFNKETYEVTYTVRIQTMECPGFRSIYARNPFMTRTHVLSNPSRVLEGPERPLTVLKERLCRTGQCFDERTILTKIHQPRRVPGVVEAADGEVIEAPLSPGRAKHRLGLQQTGSPFRSIPTAKNMLETLFDLLEVLRCLRFKRGILHRDVSVGNVMYIENPEIPEQERVEVEPLVFAKYLLEESKCPRATSLLLVDFNVGEDLEDKQDGKRSERIGTPTFISRAVELGGPVPLTRPNYVPKVPKSPECYAHSHPNRIEDFPEEIEILVDPHKLNQLMDQSQDNGWRHELDHDIESVFWLLLYWAMVAQPEGGRGEYISASAWASLMADFNARESLLVWGLSSGDPPKNLTHTVYKSLWPLISSLAAILVVDRHWLPDSDVRKRPGYICEAFQRLILEFIISNRDENFMTCRVDDSLRVVQRLPQSEALTTTPSELGDGSESEELMSGSEREIETKRRRLV